MNKLGISILDETRDYPFPAIPQRRLGQLATHHGEPIKASALIRRSLSNNWSAHDYRGVGACLAGLVAASMAQAQFEVATRLFGVVDSIIDFVRTPLLPFDQQQYERNIVTVRVQLDGSGFETASADGHQMSLEQAVAFATENRSE